MEAVESSVSRKAVPRRRASRRRSWIPTAVVFFLTALAPLFVANPYQLNLLILVAMYSVLSMTFVLMLRTGLISLAIAAFMGVGAFVSTELAMQLNMSVWLAMPTSVLVVAVLALGLGVVLIRNPGFGFVIMTMTIGMIFTVAVGNTDALGGYRGIVRIPPPNTIALPLLPPIVFASNVAFFYLMWFLALLVVVVYSAFYSAWTGRAWTAIGLNSRLAESLGVDCYRYRLLAWVLGCATAALMGAFFAHYQGSIKPDSFDIFRTMYIHVYAILGGTEFPFLGPVVGAFVMVLFPEYMRFAENVEPVITGTLLVLLIVFLPTGVLSLPGVRALATDPARTISRVLGARKEP